MDTDEHEICETENALPCSGLPRAGMVYRTVLFAANAPNGDLAYRRLFLNLKYQNRKAKQAAAAGHLDSGPLTSLSIHLTARRGRELVFLE